MSAGTASFSTSWTPATVATYYWQAIDSGDANNSPITTCGGADANEQVRWGSITHDCDAGQPDGGDGGGAGQRGDTATFSNTTLGGAHGLSDFHFVHRCRLFGDGRGERERPDQHHRRCVDSDVQHQLDTADGRDVLLDRQLSG